MVSIILFCVYGISPQSAGEVRSNPMSIPERTYNHAKYTEGSHTERRLCRKVYGEEPDLAWIRDAEPTE